MVTAVLEPFIVGVIVLYTGVIETVVFFVMPMIVMLYGESFASSD